MDVSGSAKHPQTGNLAGNKYSSTVGYFILIQSISQMMNIAVCQNHGTLVNINITGRWMFIQAKL